MKSPFISFLRHAIRFVLLFCLSASLLACSPALGYRPELSAQIIDNGTYVFHVCRRHPVVSPNFYYWYEDNWRTLQTTPMPLLELLESGRARAVFLYDPYAPPESIKFLGVEYDKLPCDKPPPPPPPPPKPPPPKPPPPKKMVAKAETPRKTSQTTVNTGPRPPSTQSREPKKNQRPEKKSPRPNQRFVGQSYPTPAPASVVQIPDPPPPVGNTHAEQTANLEQREAEARARRVGERIGEAWGETLGGAEEARETMNSLLGGGLNGLLRRKPQFAEQLQAGLAQKLDAIPLLPDYGDPKLNKIAYEAFLKGYGRGLDDAWLKFGIMNGMATVLLAVGPEAAIALETAGAKALKAAWQRLNDMPVFLPTGVGGPGGFVRRAKAPAATTQVVTTQVTGVEAEATTTVTTKITPLKAAPEVQQAPPMGAKASTPKSRGNGTTAKTTERPPSKPEAAPATKIKPVPNEGAGATRPAPAETPSRVPRTANQAQREAALERSKGANGVEQCTYCGKPLDRKSGSSNSAEIDHRQPYSKGGETVDSNLDAACRTCNRSKGNKDLGTKWLPPKDR